MDLLGDGVDSTARGIIAHGMARHGVGVVITEVIMEATTDITIIGEEVTDMPTIHLLTAHAKWPFGYWTQRKWSLKQIFCRWDRYEPAQFKP